MERPKTHFVANDRSRGLKKSAPGAGDFAKKPDVDNACKAVCDALQEKGMVYEDDQQVDVLLGRKMWATGIKGPGMDLIVCRARDATGSVWEWLMK